MNSVYTGHYYMRVWEKDMERNKGKALFAPTFSSNNLIKLGEWLYIDTKEELKKRVDDYLFPHYSQFKKSEFNCREGEYGWSYEGLFIMEDGCKIKQDSNEYTHIIDYEVEVYYIEEQNGMKRFQ